METKMLIGSSFEAGSETEELVLNPRTGEILRDIWINLQSGQPGAGLYNPDDEDDNYRRSGGYGGKNDDEDEDDEEDDEEDDDEEDDD